MRKSDKVVCSVVGLLGMAAAVLGFIAEAQRVRIQEVRVTLTGCIYPSSFAPVLAITGAVALLLAQVIANSVAGCICCTCGDRNPPNSHRTIAIICLATSWITFAIAFILLIGGAIVTSTHNEDMTSGYYCKVVKSGVFASGAVLALATVALTIVYFIKASIAMNSSQYNPQNHSISMVQPQYKSPNIDVRASKV
ncbi:hypothetical protein SUGI_0180280 [Cryptomeria japonica]|nr:hypothetical protein SUGI_0180280 [Cryptomeria japonica]